MPRTQPPLRLPERLISYDNLRPPNSPCDGLASVTSDTSSPSEEDVKPETSDFATGQKKIIADQEMSSTCEQRAEPEPSDFATDQKKIIEDQEKMLQLLTKLDKQEMIAGNQEKIIENQDKLLQAVAQLEKRKN